MRVLVTGAAGQLGIALTRFAPVDCNVVGLTRSELDITDASKVAAFLDRTAVDVIINAAAYTDVEAAERAPADAFAVNRDAVATIATASHARGIRMIHISTDFVFNGRKTEPYTVDDTPDPLNVYGASKLAGENAALAILGGTGCVLRTAWVHSAWGRNFVTKMLHLMKTRTSLRVVTDEIGTPTSVCSLARAVWRCARQNTSGLHHWSDSGNVSRFDFANAIAEYACARSVLAKMPRLQQADPGEFKNAVARPAFTPLDTRLTQAAIGLQPISWQDGMKDTLDRFSASQQGTL